VRRTTSPRKKKTSIVQESNRGKNWSDVLERHGRGKGLKSEIWMATCNVLSLYQNTPEGRSAGRPRLRWMDDVREDLTRMGVTDWRIRAHRRDDWKMVVKEAKVLQGLYSHGAVVVHIYIHMKTIKKTAEFQNTSIRLLTYNRKEKK